MSTGAVPGRAAGTVGNGGPAPTTSDPQSTGATRGEPPQDRRRSETALVAGIPALVMLVCGSIGIGDRQLWRDEQASWWASRLSFPDLWGLLDNIDVVFAPYYTYLKLWTGLFGDSELALRLPSLLWMAAVAALLGLLGRRLYDAPTGLLAGLIVAVLPTASRYAAEARPYAQTMAVTIGATLLLLRALDRPRPRRWAWYALAVAAVGLSHLVALAVLAAHALLVVGEVRGQDRRIVVRRFRPWLVAVTVGVALVVPVAAKASLQSHQIRWIPKPELLDAIRLPGALFGNRAVSIVLLSLALGGFLVSRWPSLALGTWALLAPALTFVTFDQLQLFYHRYLLFTVPAWVLLAAAGTIWVARLGRATATPGPRALLQSALAGVIVLALLVGYGLHTHRFVRTDLVEDEIAFRQVAEFVRTNARAGDGIAYGGYRYLRRAVAYELRHEPRPIDVFLAVTPERNNWYHAEECRPAADCLGEIGRIWLVTTRGGEDPLSQEPRDRRRLFRDRFTVAQVTEFHRVRVVELVAKS